MELLKPMAVSYRVDKIVAILGMADLVLPIEVERISNGLARPCCSEQHPRLLANEMPATWRRVGRRTIVTGRRRKRYVL